jgi:hypothetical protein
MPGPNIARLDPLLLLTPFFSRVWRLNMAINRCLSPIFPVPYIPLYSFLQKVNAMQSMRRRSISARLALIRQRAIRETK